MNPLLMIAATQGGGAPIPTIPGPELWPQPGFDASTGLTLTRGSVTGSQFVANNDGLGPANCAATAAGGTFTAGAYVQYSFDVIALNANDQASLLIAGNVPVQGRNLVAGTQTISGTAKLSVATTQTMTLRVDNNDQGAVKFDNCSIKVLS